MTAEEQFINYTDSYKKYGEKIELKVIHTLRVKELCIDIAKSINLSKKEIELAELCGLLHDIGRFEQWKKYKSYKDLDTIDHGDLGYNILLKNNFINKFTNKNHNTILLSVKYHNKYKVPKTLTKTNQLFANITRDADKIDILYLFVKGTLYTKTDKDSVISKRVMNTLKKKELINRRIVKTKGDEIAVRLGFVFDLKFKRSFEILKEKNYISDMIDIQINEATNNKLIEQLKELKEYINNYIEEMITC